MLPKIIKIQRCVIELQLKMSGIFSMRHSVLLNCINHCLTRNANSVYNILPPYYQTTWFIPLHYIHSTASAPWPVPISHVFYPTDCRRLSWLGWMVTYPRTVTHLSTNRTRRKVALLVRNVQWCSAQSLGQTVRCATEPHLFEFLLRCFTGVNNNSKWST